VPTGSVRQREKEWMCDRTLKVRIIQQLRMFFDRPHAGHTSRCQPIISLCTSPLAQPVSVVPDICSSRSSRGIRARRFVRIHFPPRSHHAANWRSCGPHVQLVRRSSVVLNGHLLIARSRAADQATLFRMLFGRTTCRSDQLEHVNSVNAFVCLPIHFPPVLTDPRPIEQSFGTLTV
jgi:hypothetical protein